jgi:V8-like Glu-specific endopeptidase
MHYEQEADPEFQEAQEFFDELESEGFEGSYFEGAGGMDSGELEEEIVGRRDSRRPVRNTLDVPNRWICAIDLEFEISGLGQYQRATGTLIGDRYVLTVAHALCYQVNGRCLKPRKMDVAPARDRTSGKNAPFGSSPAVEAFFADEWFAPNAPATEKFDRNFDFGLIKLRDAMAGKKHAKLKGNPLGHWGSQKFGEGTVIEIVNPQDLKNKRVSLAGYPEDKCEFLPLSKDANGKPLQYNYQPKSVQACLAKELPASVFGLAASAQFTDSGKFLQPEVEAQKGSANTLLHNIDTYGGMSGSPMWIQDGRIRKLVAIHTGSTPVEKMRKIGGPKEMWVSRAVKINSTVQRYLAEWMK